MANVKDDEFETLDFADESEYIGNGEDDAADTTTEAEHPAGEIARRRLMAAVAGLDLTEAEMRTPAVVDAMGAAHLGQRRQHDREGARCMNERAAPTDPTGHRGGFFVSTGSCGRKYRKLRASMSAGTGRFWSVAQVGFEPTVFGL